jgi:hypothetical protein
VLEHEVKSAATALLRRCTAESKSSTIKTLFEQHGIYRVSSELPFHFGQQPVAALHVDGVFSTSSSGLDPPTFVYLDLKALESRRRLRLRPTNATEDPCIAAILIAMAQARRQRTTLARDIKHATAVKAGPSGQEEEIKKPCEVSRSLMGTVHLLALHSTSEPNLYIYTARVSDALFNRLDYPSRAFGGGSVRISYQRIPFKPEASWVATMSTVITAVCGNATSEDVTHPISMYEEI